MHQCHTITLIFRLALKATLCSKFLLQLYVCSVTFKNVLEVDESAASSMNQNINRICCNVTERSRSSSIPIKAELVTTCRE